MDDIAPPGTRLPGPVQPYGVVTLSFASQGLDLEPGVPSTRAAIAGNEGPLWSHGCSNEPLPYSMAAPKVTNGARGSHWREPSPLWREPSPFAEIFNVDASLRERLCALGDASHEPCLGPAPILGVASRDGVAPRGRPPPLDFEPEVLEAREATNDCVSSLEGKHFTAEVEGAGEASSDMDWIDRALSFMCPSPPSKRRADGSRATTPLASTSGSGVPRTSFMLADLGDRPQHPTATRVPRMPIDHGDTDGPPSQHVLPNELSSETLTGQQNTLPAQSQVKAQSKPLQRTPLCKGSSPCAWGSSDVGETGMATSSCRSQRKEDCPNDDVASVVPAPSRVEELLKKALQEATRASSAGYGALESGPQATSQARTATLNAMESRQATSVRKRASGGSAKMWGPHLEQRQLYLPTMEEVVACSELASLGVEVWQKGFFTETVVEALAASEMLSRPKARAALLECSVERAPEEASPSLLEAVHPAGGAQGLFARHPDLVCGIAEAGRVGGTGCIHFGSIQDGAVQSTVPSSASDVCVLGHALSVHVNAPTIARQVTGPGLYTAS